MTTFSIYIPSVLTGFNVYALMAYYVTLTIMLETFSIYIPSVLTGFNVYALMAYCVTLTIMLETPIR